ncbi:pyruvate kinase [Clostridium paraputrificum]|uniref:pyruvate kinase n=1 Tax=Clostridium paraputrificum TaxID=29363 RepID=UPI003D325A4C
MLIIATVGPSTKEKAVLKDIIDGGANGLRLNFSHGNTEEFERIIMEARGIKKDIHILQDLSGRKIRVSDKLNYIIKIYNGEQVMFCGEDVYKDNRYKSSNVIKKIIPLNINSKELNSDKLIEISMKDNTMIFDIISINKMGLMAKVKRGGIVRAGKGCNIKGFPRDDISLSVKDREDLAWGINHSVDIICQSFVESALDIKKVKSFVMSKNKLGYKPKIWAKVETPKGIKNLDEIIEEVDGVLIGRGDLIPESSLICTPIYEEEALRRLRGKNKDIIIGTHLLNSMKNGRRAELAEVESIYYKIKDGVTGFLLAGETSVGKAPIRTVEFLKKLIDRYEKIKGEEHE